MYQHSRVSSKDTLPVYVSTVHVLVCHIRVKICKLCTMARAQAISLVARVIYHISFPHDHKYFISRMWISSFLECTVDTVILKMWIFFMLSNHGGVCQFENVDISFSACRLWYVNCHSQNVMSFCEVDFVILRIYLVRCVGSFTDESLTCKSMY